MTPRRCPCQESSSVQLWAEQRLRARNPNRRLRLWANSFAELGYFRICAQMYAGMLEPHQRLCAKAFIMGALSERSELAHKFLNYLQRPKVAAAAADYTRVAPQMPLQKPCCPR